MIENTVIALFFTTFGTIIGVVVMCLLQVNHEQDPQPFWHTTTIRKPDENDSDDLGYIWAIDTGWASCAHQVAWQRVAQMPERYPQWCRTPGLPPGGDSHAHGGQ